MLWAIWSWKCLINFTFTFPVMLMERYKSAGISQQWVASSFKGSTTVHTCVTSTQRHLDNHLQWLKVASSLSAGIKLQGIALTGWQRLDGILTITRITYWPRQLTTCMFLCFLLRYDHLSVLCELMPVGLPSLGSCLQTLLHGESLSFSLIYISFLVVNWSQYINIKNA